MGKRKDKEKEKEDFERRAALKWKCMVRNKNVRESWQKDGFGFLLESNLPSRFYQGSIGIGFFKRKKGFRYLGDEASIWKALCGIAKRYPKRVLKETIVINAVDWKEKTIIVKIHLDRGKDQIKRDFEELVDILYKEANFQKRKFNEPKFHLNQLERDLEIYDKRREGKSWNEIGLELIKEGSEKELERAADRARKGFMKGKRLIEEEHKKL